MYMLFGMFFTFFLGVLLHFVYDWSRCSLLVAFIAPTNESVFEHLKLLMSPFLLWAMAEYAYYGQYMHAFVPAKVIGLVTGMMLMLILHLLYVAVLGRTLVAADIMIFAIAVAVSFILSEFLMTLEFMDSFGLEILFDGILVLLILVFAVFTVYPPHHWLFREQ